jgi:tetratricopeptide (TPR) repeat protein
MSILDQLDRLDWREFEHVCLVLFEQYFDAPDANFYGANSVGQDGIDIRLSTIKGGRPAKVVIQCKAVQSLDWSDFSDDLERALRTFARKTIEAGQDFTFCVATTAEISNSKKFDPQKDTLIETLEMGDIKGRIHFDVYARPRLQAMGTDPVLRELFFRPERPADLYSNQDLIRLGVRMARHVERNELAMARSHLDAYLHSAKHPAAEKYDWVPTGLFDHLASLYMSAGDFEQAHRLLNAALGADPLDARYLLGYLRARRILHAVPRHNLPRAHPLERPVSVHAPEDDIEDMAPQLLIALGDTDRQLTLALWVVSYAREQDLAEQGLNRALGLVAQAWPSDVARLDKDAYYVLREEGYLERLPTRYGRRLPASIENLKACALTIAYEYIRNVHGARFGFDSVRRVEGGHDGWPAAVNGLSSENATTFFSGLQMYCHRALRTYLPSLQAEGGGREFGRDHTDRSLRSVPPRLDSTPYVATSEFLLRDCEAGLVAGRVDELARATLMGNGASILISHLGLERLVRVLLGERLCLDGTRMPDQALAMANAIASILGSLARLEPAGDERLLGLRPPFVSRPCYANFATSEQVNSRGASIELARSRRSAFLGGSYLELNLASTELPPADRHLLYWKPATFPTWT